MIETKPNKITVVDCDGNTAEFSVHRGACIDEWIHIFKSITYWLTFDIEIINEAFKDEEDL